MTRSKEAPPAASQSPPPPPMPISMVEVLPIRLFQIIFVDSNRMEHTAREAGHYVKFEGRRECAVYEIVDLPLASVHVMRRAFYNWVSIREIDLPPGAGSTQ